MWKLELSDNDRGRTEWVFGEKISAEAERELASEQKEIFARYDAAPGRNSDDKVYTHLALAAADQSSARAGLLRPYAGAAASSPRRALDAAISGARYYRRLQTRQGFWPGDYGGPMFLLPGMAICRYVTGCPLRGETAAQCLRYVRNRQNSDGGWGSHVQSERSTMFGSVLNYVAARLLGARADDAWVRTARAFVRQNGGPLHTTPWGKFWLAVLGVYSWDGVNSLAPELWLLPEAVPVHPSRWWCHCRMVYLPMAYIYAKKYSFAENALTRALKAELYGTEYGSVRWAAHMCSTSRLDRYFANNVYTERALAFVANVWESVHPAGLREKAADFLLEYIRAEDEQTDSIDIGPVNKAFNMLCIWLADGPDSKTFRKHLERSNDYFWLAEDGMKLQGYNGSQLWDTAFAMMAIAKTLHITDEFKECFLRAYDYVDKTQVREPIKDADRFYRHDCVGGWPFSTKSHGWPISDCTSHGLTAVMIAHELNAVPATSRISDERIFNSVNLLLTYQNSDGGFPTYELQRGSALLELLNPTATFDRIMVDYTHNELAGSAVIALCHFRKLHPTHRTAEIGRSIERAVAYLKQNMRPDGSWYGNWGVCFTYASFYAVRALILAGEPRDSDAIRRACRFLASKQTEDGGWGETYESCVKKEYCQNKTSQVVNTAWAVISLMEADYADLHCIRRGVQLISKRQREDGGWTQEDISGVFNANIMITYTAYKNVFSIWALAMFAEKYEYIDI